MNAVILAGGQGRRMGSKVHKALLPVGGVPMIQAVATKIGGCFNEIIISAQSREPFAFLPYPVVTDREPGHGPLMGILCALEASSREVNFFIACDIPEIDTGFIETMAAFTDDYEIVVPVNRQNQFEPLFAFYNKSLIRRIEALLALGVRQIFQLYPDARVKTVPMDRNTWYRNLNTETDYREYLRAKHRQ